MITFKPQGGSNIRPQVATLAFVDPGAAADKLDAIVLSAYEKSGMKMATFAQELGLRSHTLISNLKYGRAHVSPKIAKRLIEKFPELVDAKEIFRLLQYAKSVGDTSPEEPTGTSKRPSRKDGYLPVVGRAACGDWIEAVREGRTPTGEESWEKIAGEISLAKKTAFFVRAQGDSMTGPTPSGQSINDGDLLLVDPTAPLVTGRAALVVLDGKVTVKIWREFGDQILLSPTNPKFKDLPPISREEFARDGGVAYRITGVQSPIRQI